MAIWIELRCEDRGGDNEDCFSDVNNDPGYLAYENISSMIEVKRLIERSARSDGWVRTRDGWICPNCAAIRKSRRKASRQAQPEEAAKDDT